MAAIPNGMFKPDAPGQSVATLVLIENSAAMMERWQDLRDRYLPTLLGTMRMANPVVPIQVLWLTSCPAAAERASPPPHGSRQFNQLPELRFNHQPNNRISPATMHHGAELLASTCSGVPTARHLIIVAASGPSDSAEGFPGINGNDRSAAWHALRGKLFQEKIHLHMILNPNENTKGFVDLFYNMLDMQNCEEVPSWFPVDHLNYHFFLSTRKQNHLQPGLTAASALPLLPTTASHYPEHHQFQPPPHPPPSRMPLPRNNSFPPAGHSSRSSRSPTSARPDAETPRPSLVKHLQKIHGLTKKRTYGLQPSRQPFIRDDSSDLSMNDAKTPLDDSSPEAGSSSAPMSARPLSSRAVRRSSGVNASRKAVEESRRPRRSSVQFNPATQARVSSPDSDSSTPTSSPTSVSPMSAISPITPVSMHAGMETMRAPMSVPRSGPGYEGARAMLPPADASETVYPSAPSSDTVAPPIWVSDDTLQLAQSNGELPLSTGFQPPLPAFSESITPVQTSHPLSHAPALPVSNYASLQPPGGRNYTTAYQQPGSAGVSVASSPIQPLGQVPDDGDKPFIFYPEYEDQKSLSSAPPMYPPAPSFQPSAANYQLPPAMPHLVSLQPPYSAYPPPSGLPAPGSSLWSSVQSAGGADYSHILNPAVSPGLLRSDAHTTAPLYSNPVYSSEQSSSLQSWAAGY